MCPGRALAAWEPWNCRKPIKVHSTCGRDQNTLFMRHLMKAVISEACFQQLQYPGTKVAVFSGKILASSRDSHNILIIRVPRIRELGGNC